MGEAKVQYPVLQKKKQTNTVSAGSSLTLSLLFVSFTFLLSEFTSTRSVVSVVLSPWLAAALEIRY